MRDKSFFERIFIMLIAMEFVLLAGVLIAQWSVVSKSSMDEITAGSEDKLGVIKGYSEAVLHDEDGYKKIPHTRIQGWGQGLALAFLAELMLFDEKIGHTEAAPEKKPKGGKK